MKVRNIGEGFSFTNDTEDVNQINDMFGESYNSYFYKIEDGEFISLYGISGIIPYLDKEVYKVL